MPNSPHTINGRHALRRALIVRCCDTRGFAVRFSEDEYIIRDLVHLEEDARVGKEVSLTCGRRAVWGMLYADGASIVSKSAEGLAKRMTAILTVFEVAALTVSEEKTNTMLLRIPGQTSLATSLVIETPDQSHR